MTKRPFLRVLLCTFFSLISLFSLAQSPDGFDYKKAYHDAKNKGIGVTDIDGYVTFLHNDYLSHKDNHKHVSPQNLGVYDAGTIYLNGNHQNNPFAKPINPNTPQNAYCPNAGFEQLNFTNWSASSGSVSTGVSGAAYPVYTQTSTSVLNSSGNNVSLVNTLNFHTITSTPATNSVYPNCIGYDSIACRVVGTQTISEIPVVNPNGGPASVRLNGALSNYRASKLTYNMSLNPNNKNFNVSYAIVLSTDKSFPHTAAEQPYFSVKITDQNGNLIQGCSQYTVTIDTAMFNPNSPNFDPSWTESALDGTSSTGQFYRKWATYAFDFSNFPAITSVNVEFYVGGCTGSGHFGYAYVDASCAQGGAVASFCAGSNTSVLTAPGGYSSYQWTGPSGPVSVANGGNTGTATVSPVSAGQVFTCNVVTSNGCSSVFQSTISITTVSVTGIGSTPSCQNGNSGTANVSATGSSSGYSYQWLNSALTNVGNTQSVTGLSPGIYSVTVTSPLCGSASETVAVGVSPPSFYSLSAPYCGSTAWITKTGGSNYKWYTASPLALIAGVTTASLTINSPVNGAGYFLVYTTASGCKDSIKYILSQQTGGSINVSNVKSICPGSSNSYAVINLQTSASPVYSYSVTGPGGYSSTLNATSLLKDSISGLSIGTYSATVFDGQCIYNTTFTVSPFVFNYTLTPSSTVICSPGSSTLAVNFGNTTPSTCGLSTTSCTNPNIIQVGNGTTGNSSTSNPCPYGNYYKNIREQYLFTAAELTAAGVVSGNISSISFIVNSILPLNTSGSSSSSTYVGTLPNYSIKMKCSSATALTNFDNVGLTQVYLGNFTPVIGVNTHNFNQSYSWDGVSSLLVDICYIRTTALSSSYYTSNPVVPYTNTGTIKAVYYTSDTQLACGNTTGTTSSSRPNIKFGNCGGLNQSAFTYSWAPAAGLSSTNSYTTIATPTVSTIYTVQVTPIGQTNCMQAQSSTVTAFVPLPAVISTVNPMCTNASTIALSVTPMGGNWTGQGITPAGVLTPSLAAIGSNTYSYSLGTGTCSSTGSTTISIEQFIPSVLQGTISPICLPSSTINLSSALSTSTLGSGVWSGAGITGNTFDPSIAGAGTFTLTYSTNSSPTASLCPSSNIIVVQLNSVVPPVLTTTVSSLCTNASSLMLTATPLGGTWLGSGVNASGVLNPAIANVGTNTYTYSVGSSTCSAANTTTISIIPFVPASITHTVGPYCFYDAAINLQTLTPSPGGLWSGAGVSGTMFTPALAGVGPHVVSYVTNPSLLLNCGSTETTSILVIQKPEANAFPNVLSGCNPVTVNYQTSNYPTGLGIWDFGDGTPKDTGLYISHIYSVPGTYTATLYYTDVYGCKDTTIANSGVINNPLPLLRLTLL